MCNFKLNFQGDICLTVDAPYNSNDAKRVGGCDLVVSSEAGQYERLRYTTDLNTLRLIFQNKTFRSNSLTYARLNDSMEKQRNGIEPLAACRYITCFSHDTHESVPFWVSYGMQNKEKKVQLCFNNFANDFQDKVNMDYALIKENKKLLFRNKDFFERITAEKQSEAENEGYCLIADIDRVSMFDIEYIPTDDEEFTMQYRGEGTMEVKSGILPATYMNATTLGRKKSNPWEYEHETRIMVSVGNCCNVGEWIDLRLKDEMFRDLIIIKSPWEDESLQGEIEAIIQNSELADDVKASIRIKDSEVKGTLNFE